MTDNNKQFLRVHSWESLGTYDGPGLRLVIFLQGCNFKCLYCANVDTLTHQGGTMTDPDEIIRRAISEQPFFGKKGGVTFSGGEATLQAKALIPVVKKLHEHGINVCLDTNGSIWNDDVKTLIDLTEHILLDVKEINNNHHKQLTNNSNANTLQMAKYLEETNHPFCIRYVLVPGYTDNEKDLEEFALYFKDYKNIEYVEILPYHRLGQHKYEALGLEYQLKSVKENTEEQKQKAYAIFSKYLKKVLLA